MPIKATAIISREIIATRLASREGAPDTCSDPFDCVPSGKADTPARRCACTATSDIVGGVRARASVIILLVVAVLFAIIGTFLVVASTAPQTKNTSFHLPIGNYYTYIRFDVLTGGTLDVTYQVSPGVVEQRVMTGAEFSVLQSGGTPSAIFDDMGSSGGFHIALPSGGTYYLVSTHGTGFENTDQSGTHTMTVQGISPTPFIGGVISFVVASVLVVIGLWLRTRPPRARLPAYPPYAFGAGVPPLGGSMGPAQVPNVGPAFAPIAYGTVLVTLENPAALDANVQLFVNGLLVTSLPVPAGQTGQATLHPGLSNPYGTSVRVEAVTMDGRRASQDVTATADAAVSVALRIQ